MTQLPLPAFAARDSVLRVFAVVCVMAFATVASIAAQHVHGDVRSDLTIVASLASGIGCFAGSTFRRAWKAIVAHVCATAGAAVGVALATVQARWYLCIADPFPPDPYGVLAAGAALGAACAPIVAVLVNARNAEAHDRANRFLTRAGVWLALAAGVATWSVSSRGELVRFHFAERAPYSQIQWWQSVFGAWWFGVCAAAVASCCLMVSVVWDHRRLAWLGRVLTGKEQAWRVVARRGDDLGVRLVAMYRNPSACDGVLVRRERTSGGAFRSTDADLAVALVATDWAVSERATRLRAGVALLVVAALAVQAVVVAVRARDAVDVFVR